MNQASTHICTDISTRERASQSASVVLSTAFEKKEKKSDV